MIRFKTYGTSKASAAGWPKRIHGWRTAGTCAVLLFALTGCGQKGPLFMPVAPAAPAPVSASASATPATPAEPVRSATPVTPAPVTPNSPAMTPPPARVVPTNK